MGSTHAPSCSPRSREVQEVEREVVVKKKRAYSVSKEGDLEDLYFEGNRTNSLSKEGNLGEFVVKSEPVESLSDIVVKRKRDDSTSNESDLDDIVVVQEVKRRQTDFMVENVRLALNFHHEFPLSYSLPQSAAN